MRTASLVLVLFLFVSCKNRNNFTRPDDAKKHIIIQPLNGFGFDQEKDAALLQFLRKELMVFYQRDVIIAAPLTIPVSFINREKSIRYSADSILKFLAARKNDTIATIIAITHEDIFTTIYGNSGRIKPPEYKYKVWGIFGLGYEPGAACVISDHRLAHHNGALFHHRIRTVALHEIGHNLGLPHCPTPGCIMSDANEKIATVNNSGRDHCSVCKQKLK